MAEIKTVADVRRMLDGKLGPEGAPPEPDPEAESSDLSGIVERELTNALHDIVRGDGPAPEPEATPVDLSGLGLSAEQVEALVAAGFTDRDALRAAGYDDLLAVPTIGRVTVNNLREQLEAD